MATSTISPRAKAPKIPDQPREALPLEEQIRQRAHQIWLENGSPVGTELVDWLNAKKEILDEQR